MKNPGTAGADQPGAQPQRDETRLDEAVDELASVRDFARARHLRGPTTSGHRCEGADTDTNAGMPAMSAPSRKGCD
jgi:hypothetical protein